MSADLSHDSDLGMSGREDNEGSFSRSGATRGSLQKSPNDNTSWSGDNISPARKRGKSRSEDAIEARWNELRKDYNDQYLELFQATFKQEEDDDDDPLTTVFSSTQLGAVTWLSDEKSSLYKAVARFGRHNLPKLAKFVKTKSIVEVRTYLQSVQRQEADRHSFARHVEDISHADIPAAIEVGTECEAALSKAADALAAAQDSYDNAFSMHKDYSARFVDQDAAVVLDQAADKQQDDISCDDGETEAYMTQMFRLTNWVNLSERVFMNPGGQHSEHNWRRLAICDETPALATSAISDIYDLTANLTRRLVQSSIFLAQSRIRSSNVRGYTAQRTVKKCDVASAADVLGIKSDLWLYFSHIPRRNHLTVIADTHEKGSSTKQGLISYDALEALLAVRTASEFRRSRSATTDMTSNGDSGTESEAESSIPPIMSPTPALRDSPLDSSLSDSNNYEKQSSGSMSAGSDSQDSGSGEDHELAFHASTFNYRKRQLYLEREQDDYVESLDRIISEREEAHLWEVLGKEGSSTVKVEPGIDKLVSRPKVLRKTKDDLRDWTTTEYVDEWEHLGMIVPQESFVQTGRQRKRLKVHNT